MTQQDGTTTQVVVALDTTAGGWKAFGWNSDARVLYLRRRGADLTVTLLGGTFAHTTEATKTLALSLQRPTAGNYTAVQRGNALEVVSSWTPDAAK